MIFFACDTQVFGSKLSTVGFYFHNCPEGKFSGEKCLGGYSSGGSVRLEIFSGGTCPKESCPVGTVVMRELSGTTDRGGIYLEPAQLCFRDWNVLLFSHFD